MTEPTRVVHMRRDECDVRIDRRSPWGNPYRVADVLREVRLKSPRVSERYARDLAITAFIGWLNSERDDRAKWIKKHVGELKGKRLGCWCAPLPCHGDVLAAMADAT